jgi:hypothetical protein
MITQRERRNGVHQAVLCSLWVRRKSSRILVSVVRGPRRVVHAAADDGAVQWGTGAVFQDPDGNLFALSSK